MGRGLNAETKPRREAHRPEKAQLVFFKAPLGQPDGANHTGIEVGEATDMVDYGRSQRLGCCKRVCGPQGVEQQAVDGEVPALYILFGECGVANFIGMAAVGVHAIGPECRHLRGVLGTS